MTDIIINNTSNDYFDVFQTDLFTRPSTRPLNWLEMEKRGLGKQQEDDDETGEKDDRND